MKRESFKSRLGFILVSAGCAIGIGNVWRFPYVTGQNGGGIFVLFYLIFLVCMGLPVLTMELAVGRASRKSAVMSYKALEKEGSKWHIHGWIAMLGCYMLMMYYTTVSGWMVAYFFKFLKGDFTSGMNTDDTAAAFGNLLADPKQMAFWMIVTVVLGFLVCSRGLQNGLEKISKFMMSALFLLIIVLAVHSVTLSGALEGVKFYLIPNLDAVSEIGIKNVITAAMNQAFFTLSLGVAAMEIFGSYMGKDCTLAGEGAQICAIDTFVAIMSGLIIFPACFSYGVEVGAGPSLIFISLPKVFDAMGIFGRPVAIAFFLMMGFAALTSCVSVMETLVANCMELYHKPRKKMCGAVGIYSLVTAVLICLGYNKLYFELKLPNGSIGQLLDVMDYISNSFLMPFISLLTSILIGWVIGPDWIVGEVERNGEHFKRAGLYRFMIRYVVPVVMLILFLVSTGFTDLIF